jgi:hypothetical protein
MGAVGAGGQPMRRIALVGLVTLALLAAEPAAGSMYIGLEDLTCGGVTVDGTGLPQSTQLDVALVDPASKLTIQQGTPTTSASGSFSWTARVSLSGKRAIRAVVSQPGRDRPLAWTQQSIPRACPLAMTGVARPLPLVGVGASSFTLGVLLLLAFAYRGRHAGLSGRHLATPHRGRHTAPY